MRMRKRQNTSAQVTNRHWSNVVSSKSEENSDSDASSDVEEVIGAVGMWSSTTKKGWKEKKVEYVCTGGKKTGKVIEGKEKASCVRHVGDGST